jgi:primosomal protein N' (replication factor Y)
MRAKINKAVCLLGSATPSLESFHNSESGKYTRLELPFRAMNTRQPEVEIVDMIQELRSPSKYIKNETPEQRFLSSKLIAYISHALEKKHGIILLQNRRGYSAYLECQQCGNVRKCPDCDITLIFHKLKNHLRCHYCGHSENVMSNCELCESKKLKLKGTGTEKVEEEILRLFPGAKVRRMDSDTVRRKDAHRKILKSFHEGEFDVLIGTQMVSKGLDFPNVHLVGVVSADIGLFSPDFRSHENTFQMMMQVAGRSGRTSDSGRVVIQSMHSENYIFPFIRNHDYISFYEKETGFRKNFHYPPFSRLALAEFRCESMNKASATASKAYLFLKRYNENRGKFFNGENQSCIEILKPAPAIITKIRGKYRYHIILKLIRGSSGFEVILKNLQNWYRKNCPSGSPSMSIDVDPVSFY